MNFHGGLKGADYGNRCYVYQLFKNKPYCYAAGRKKFLPYMKQMSNFKFTLSPRGYGIDCYRNWEALFVGTIPIVETSQLDPLFADLPVLIIDKWEDITEEYLEQKYQEMTSKKYNIEKLFLEYWHNRIHDVRNSFLGKYRSPIKRGPILILD